MAGYTTVQSGNIIVTASTTPVETSITITPNTKAWGTAEAIDYSGAGAGWGTAEAIDYSGAGAGDSSYPQVAIDGSGNAVAVWRQSDGTRNVIYTNRFQ
jgi:methylaspartate ammonia-lyase